MIENLPVYISIVFALTTVLTLLLFHNAVLNSTSDNSIGNAKIILSILSFWLVIHAVLGLNDFYSADTTGFPPRLAFAFVPPFVTIFILFLTKRGLAFIDNLPLINITYLNIIRIPVEIVLYWLLLHKAVPKLMTFEGKNFDIISGITAPFIAYFGFSKEKLSKKIILFWNVIALLLLLNVLTLGVLSAPSIMQSFSFIQPNIAVLHFPFVWLPAFIVPLIFFGHLVSIRQLLKAIKQIE
jgi:hypothetical protein